MQLGLKPIFVFVPLNHYLRYERLNVLSACLSKVEFNPVLFTLNLTFR
jgi:hypothetical protein